MTPALMTTSVPVHPSETDVSRDEPRTSEMPRRRMAVEFQDVSKSFGRQKAVDRLSLRVPEQSICGFIGPNGSGKTTTLRLIMRMYHPDGDRGTIRVLGEEGMGPACDRVGYLPEERGLYKRMKVADLLRFYAELKGCANVDRDVRDWLGRMGLTDAAGKRVEALSKGMAQKVQFIATVIGRPALIILDEPFSGLDPVNAEIIRETILELRNEGATIVFSTHDMPVAEVMCDFIVMIFRGKKVLDGTMDAIQRDYGADTLRVRLNDPGARLDNLPGVGRVTDLGGLKELRLLPDGDPQRILHALLARGDVHHFEITRPRLHDIFVRIARPAAPETVDA